MKHLPKKKEKRNSLDLQWHLRDEFFILSNEEYREHKALFITSWVLNFIPFVCRKQNGSKQLGVGWVHGLGKRYALDRHEKLPNGRATNWIHLCSIFLKQHTWRKTGTGWKGYQVNQESKRAGKNFLGRRVKTGLFRELQRQQSWDRSCGRNQSDSWWPHVP